MVINASNVLRLSSFVSIITGMLALFGYVLLSNGKKPVLSPVALISPDEALGLVFMGFAVRMSRLESKRAGIRAIVRTSRIALFIVGIFLMLDMKVFRWVGMQIEGESSFAAGVCYALIGASLSIRKLRAGPRIGAYLSAISGVFLVVCGFSGFLDLLGVAPKFSALAIGWVPGIVLTAVSLSLAITANQTGVSDILSGSSPGGEVARKLFPVALGAPLLLAVLRDRAEAGGYLPAQSGLLLHVTISALFMGLLIAWNATRINFAHPLKSTAEAAYTESEKLFRELLAVVRQPVWLLDATGRVLYSNPAALRFASVDARLSGALGNAQQRDLVAAAMVGRPVHTVHVHDLPSAQDRSLSLVFLRLLQPQPEKPGELRVLVIASTGDHPPAAPASLEESLTALQESAGTTENTTAPV